jgi:hypothetical protein
MSADQFLKGLKNIEKELSSIKKVIASTKQPTKSKKVEKQVDIKKLIKSIENCNKKSELKKFTVTQLMEFIKHKGIKVRKGLKGELVDAVWDSIADSDSDSSDSDSDSSDYDSDSGSDSD